MNIGAGHHSGENLGTNGMDNAICWTLFCFTAWQISRYEKCLPCGTMILSVKIGM